jgi:hypothetical protein
MIVFQKEAMILRFGQVSFEQTADKAEDVVQFVIAEPFDKCLQQRIVGKFLQIIHDGVLVIFAVEPEADQSLVGFNELMRMCGHGVGLSFFQSSGVRVLGSGFSPAAGLKSGQFDRERNYAILA